MQDKKKYTNRKVSETILSILFGEYYFTFYYFYYIFFYFLLYFILQKITREIG